MIDFEIAVCDWTEVRTKCDLNPTFGEALQKHKTPRWPAATQPRKPSTKVESGVPQIIRVRARYGATIASNGTLNWEALQKAKIHDGATIDWDEFQYSNIPICIVTNGACEVWTERMTALDGNASDVLSVPHFVALKGDFLGLFETLSPLDPPAWNITSGVRSLFFSTPVNDIKKVTAFLEDLAPKNKRLKDLTRLLKLDEDAKVLLSDHSLIVHELLRDCPLERWHSEFLIFGQSFLESLGVAERGLPQLVSPSPAADLLKTFTIAQLAAALQVHLAMSHDTDGHTFTAERSAARLVAMAKGAAPVFAPVLPKEVDLLPTDLLSEQLQKTKPIHNLDQHHFILFAPQPLARSRFGYFSLHVPHAEFDWKRPIRKVCLIEVANQLKRHKDALNDAHIKFVSSKGPSREDDVEIISIKDAWFMKNGANVCLMRSDRLIKDPKVETPLSNPFFKFMVELETKREAT